MNRNLRDETQKQYKIMCDGMNKKFHFISELKKFYEKYEYIPDEYAERWAIFMTVDRGLLWYENKDVIRTLKKAAKKAAMVVLERNKK